MTTTLHEHAKQHEAEGRVRLEPDAGPLRTSDAPARERRPGRRWIVWLLLLLVVAGAVAAYVSRNRKAATAEKAQAASAADRVVPVVEAKVSVRDVPIVLEGLGNALPLATVTVKTQVDGRLDKVFFVEGQRVKKGELIAQIDPRPFTIQLHTAQAALARDGAQLRNAKLNLDRYKTLVGQKLIPQQQVDDQQTMADQLEATVMTDQAQAETARLQLDYAQVKSPLDGVTGLRQVDPGNVVHPGDASGIVVITQLDPIGVVFTLPQDELPRVSKQLASGPVDVEAWSRDGLSRLALGKLQLVDNEVNTQTATIKLKAVFPNADRALWPNAFVKARLLLATRKGAVVVPATVVQRGPQGTFCYVIGADNTVSMRPIDVDLTQGDWTIIAKGVTPGDRVVVDGQSQLRPGAKVAPKPEEPAGGSAAHASPSPRAADSAGGAADGARGSGARGGAGGAP